MSIEEERNIEATESEKRSKRATALIAVGILLLAAACVFLAVKLISLNNNGQSGEPLTTVTEAQTQPAATPVPVDVEEFLSDTDAVIATVNGVEVDSSLYDYYKVQNVYTFRSYGVNITSDIAAYLEQMCFYNAVQNELMEQLASQMDISITEAEARDQMNEVISEYFEDEADFRAWAEDVGITEQQYLDNTYYNLVGDAIYRRCASEVSVTEEECRAIYADDPSQYDTRTTSHILIKFVTEGDTPTEEEKLTAYNRALAVLEKVKAEPDKFAELAREYSDDGSAEQGGVINYSFTSHETALFSEYVAGTWALDGVGAFSPEPVESSAGYHIIKVDGEVTGYENFAAAIRQSLLAERAEARFDEIFDAFVEDSEIEQVFDFQYADKLEF